MLSAQIDTHFAVCRKALKRKDAFNFDLGQCIANSDAGKLTQLTQ